MNTNDTFKKYEFELLGSKIFILLPQNSPKTIVEECYEECLRIDDWYSRFKEHNTLSLLNDNLNQWQEVDEELLYLFSKAKEFEENTNAAFTLHTKEILETWGYDSNYNLNKIDDEYELIEDIEKREYLADKKKNESSKESLIAKVFGIKKKNSTKKDQNINQTSFKIDIENSSVFLNSSIELGGLGKGYALDKMIQICKKKASTFLVNAGGDLFALSDKKEGFQIQLEDPDDINKSIGTIYVNNFALASTSANRRKWKGVHHIVDPKKNRPANEMLATYVQAQKGIDADAYATALFVLGFEKAQKTAQELGLEVLLLSKRNQIWKTKNFKCALDKNIKYSTIN